MVIISCVRSNDNNGGKTSSEAADGNKEAAGTSTTRTGTRNGAIGFLADTHRLNVALTRAKYALYIVGNFKVLQVCKINFCCKGTAGCYK